MKKAKQTKQTPPDLSEICIDLYENGQCEIVPPEGYSEDSERGVAVVRLTMYASKPERCIINALRAFAQRLEEQFGNEAMGSVMTRLPKAEGVPGELPF